MTGFIIYSWINLCFTVSIFLVPYIIATDIDYMMARKGILVIELVIDFSLFFDILLGFFTQYESNGKEIKSLWKIWMKYIFTFFIFDLISVFPAIVTWETYSFLYYLKIARFLKTPWFFNSINFILNYVRSTFPKLLGK